MRRRSWSLTQAFSYAFSVLAVGVLALMAILFVAQSWPAWRQEGIGLITGTKWFHRSAQFGAAPMIYGTLVVSSLALLLAVPLGIGAAIFTSEFLPPRFRLGVKITAELLAGIPSVVYGLIGLLILRDWIYKLIERFDPLSGDTLLTAAVLLSIMILPTIVTLSDDALRGVSSRQRLAARGLGLNATEAAWFVALPQAAPGLLAAVLLALGRALGEAIAVFLVIGKRDNQWPANLFSLRPLIESGQTLSSKLGGSETMNAYGDSVHWGAIVALGLILMILAVGFTWLSARLKLHHHDAAA